MVTSHKVVCLCGKRQFIRMEEKCVLHECPECGIVWLLETRPETDGRIKVREEYATTTEEEVKLYIRTRQVLGLGAQKEKPPMTNKGVTL